MSLIIKFSTCAFLAFWLVHSILVISSNNLLWPYMENVYAERCQAKNFRKETKFLSEKLAEKSRFRELSTNEIQKMLENVISAATKKRHKLWLEIIAFEEGECLPFVYCTRSSNHSVCHAISRFGRHLGPACHTLPRSHIRCVQFFSPGSWYLFCDTRSQMKRWRFSVYHRFVYSFSRSFQLSFFIIGKFPF